MEIQFGTVDGLVNISDSIIKIFCNGIIEFSKVGLRYTLSKKLAIGAGFQRFIEPVYSGRASSFDISSIDVPALTRNGKEQSPARLTYCKKMGLVKVDDSSSAFEPTELCLSVAEGKIRVNEYALLLLSKMGIFKDGRYIDNLLVALSVVVDMNTALSLDQLSTRLCEQYGCTNDEIIKTRLDIILKSLEATNLITKITSEYYSVSSYDASIIFQDIINKRDTFSLSYLDTDINYADHVGSLSGGIIDVITLETIGVYSRYFPSLVHCVHHSGHLIQPTDKNVAYSLQDYEYIAAIKAKPFLILGGFSGTGKSLAVKRLAFSACPADGSLNLSETSPGNYLLISVKPNWHDATDLTGFRSSVNRNYYVTDFMRFLVKAMHHPDVPFFVCLDEMNLAPVEEYFSDFLSVIESRKRKANGKVVTDALVPASVFNDTTYAADFNIFMSLGLETSVTPDEYEAMDEEHRAEAFVRQDIVDELKREGLTIPQNVIVVGTVNMDDTTNTFSRKVIDRAMTFETIVGTFDASYFTDSIILNYVEEPRKWELFKSDEVNAQQMVSDGRFKLVDADKDAIVGFINNINEDLEGTPFKISYRILNESVLLYRAKKKIAEIMNADGGFEKDVDFDVELNSVFDDILMQKVLPRIEGDSEKCRKCLAALKSRAVVNGWQKSAEKIQFMIDRFGSDGSGFTSFWN